ncbi:MAG: universal stress protein [Chloroflexota bacterium]
MTAGHVSSTLLVPLDGSELAESALAYAKLVAAPDTSYVLLRVVDGGSAGEAAEAAAEASLRASARLLGDTAKVSFVSDAGDPATVIVEQAVNRGASAIVMATHGRGAIGRWLHGSVADRVARTTPVPVLILRGGDDSGVTPNELRRVLLPYDGSEVARGAIPAAMDIALAKGIPVHVLTAVDVSSLAPVSVPGAAMPMSGDVYEEVYDELVSQARSEAEAAAAILHDRGVAATTEVRVGPPAIAIEDVLRTGDLVVLSSHGRTGVQRWLLGSVSEQLVRSAPGPVLLVPVAGRETASA